MIKRKKTVALGLASMALMGHLTGISFANEAAATQTITGDDIVITGLEMESPQSAAEVKDSIDNLERLLEVYNKYSGEFKYEINKDLSQEQINARYDAIETKYSLGDELTNEDSEFVIRYDRTGQTDINTLLADTDQQLMSLRTKGSHTFTSTVGKKTFSNTKTQYGLDMSFSGTIQWHNGHAGSTQHKITVDSKSSCSNSHLKKRKHQLSVKAYGLNMSNNIFVAYDKTIGPSEVTGTGTKYFSDSTGNYDVLIHVKTVVTPRTNFTTQNGSSTYIDGF